MLLVNFVLTGDAVVVDFLHLTCKEFIHKTPVSKNFDVDVLVKHGRVNELRKAVEGMIVADDVIELHSKQVELGF